MITVLAVGVALGILASCWRRPVAWQLTRVHPDEVGAPRVRVWHNGVEIV
jgi:hypothetical protein